MFISGSKLQSRKPQAATRGVGGAAKKKQAGTKPAAKKPVTRIAVKSKAKKVAVVGAKPAKPKPKVASKNTKPTPAAPAAPEPPKEPVHGSVVIRYNHYKESFPTVDGALNATVVDEKYYLSYAFKKCKLHLSTKQWEHGEDDECQLVPEKPAGTFQTLIDGETYWVVVEEDAEAKAESEKRQTSFKASDLTPVELKGQNNASKDLTKQLKSMTTEQLKAKGADYKQMIEARDLEDILYS